MGDRLPTSSKPTDRRTRGASDNLSGTLAFDNWPDPRPEPSTQHSPHSRACKQPVPVGCGPQPAVGQSQATASQIPSSTRMPSAERTLRAPPPQTLLAFRERPKPSNVNQNVERNEGRRNESPTAFLSRILSEPRPSRIERRQTSMKERHGDREIEHADLNGKKRTISIEAIAPLFLCC